MDNKHNFKIYRKPTQTDHTIHNSSDHPPQFKIAAYNHMLHRLNNIPMSTENYNEEFNTICHIATQNGFNITLINRLNVKILNRIQLHNLTSFYTDSDHNNKKYIPVEYNSNTSHIMQKIFNTFNYTLAYTTKHKIQQKLRSHNNIKYDCGIYKLICNDCPKFYIGQTGRSFATRFSEHTHEIRNTHTGTLQTKNIKSNFALHIINEKHTYTDINNNLKILHKLHKGNNMNRLEELEIYRHRNNPLLLNDKINSKTNKIYELILNKGYN